MSNVFNVVDYGAIGDGKTKSTKAIAEAIEACAAAKGGRVLIPAGEFLTGPIVLRSNVELHVETGATVRFSKDRGDYPLVATNYEGREVIRCMAPIYGKGLQNVAITGGGVFDGSGEVWRPVKKMKMTERQWADLLASGGAVDERAQIWWPTEQAARGGELLKKLREGGRELKVEDYEPVRDFLRPCLLQLVDCRNVRLEGPTFQNSPAWNLHPLLCENVTVRNVRVLNPWWSQNGDGLDLDSCRNCLVVDSHFDVGDDAICLKSGRDEAGRRLGRPTENVTVVNCTVVHGHGGLTIGSEMSGGVRNVEVSNCLFNGTDVGLRFKTARGRGGVVENIRIDNVTMANIRDNAIDFSMFYAASQPEPLSERTPVFRNFIIRNVTCREAGGAISLHGLIEMPIESITIENARISAKAGVSIIDAKDISLIGVEVEAAEAPVLRCERVANLQLDRFVGRVKA